MKQKENLIAEESLKNSKQEEKFEDYRLKTSKKLSKLIEKYYRLENFYIHFRPCYFPFQQVLGLS